MRPRNFEGNNNFNIEVWLVCTSLGVVNRGFEQYISSLALHLASSGMANQVVVSGGKLRLKNARNQLVGAVKLFKVLLQFGSIAWHRPGYRILVGNLLGLNQLR